MVEMSNLDPFTQKLLERTQARKQAVKIKRENIASKKIPHINDTSSLPLSENNGQTHLSQKNKKRPSTEGIEAATSEKKLKENKGSEPLFSHCQASNKEYVVPSNAGRTPKKVNCGSTLSSRLAGLNREYEEKFALDFAEEQRKKEAKTIQEERHQQHARIQEEERQRMLKEKIFGKTHAKNVPEKKKESAPKHSSISVKNLVTASPSSKFSIQERSKISKQASSSTASPKRMAPQPPKNKDNTNESPVKRKAPLPPEPALIGVEKEKDNACASVCTKMSIFEEKMKQEKAARQKELETEAWLRKKAPRNKETLPLDEKVKSEEKDGIAFMLTTKTPQKEKHQQNQLKGCNDEPLQTSSTATPLKSIQEVSNTPITTPAKNYTGSISSPQPVDCTEDTNTSDSKAFDISEILRAAEKEQQLSPPPITKLEHVPKSEKMLKMNERTDRTPIRSSTMKKAAGESPLVLKPMIDIDLTPVQMEDDEDSVPVEFTPKETHPKSKQAAESVKNDRFKTSTNRSKPQKPLRHNAEFPPTYEEFLIAKQECQIPLGFYNKDTVEGIAVKWEKCSTPTLQQLKPSTPVKSPAKSGYNCVQSAKYDAQTAFDKPDIVYSKRDKIQNLLEKAATQQNIVLQTSQALNVAENSVEDKSGSPEVIEGERLLLLATERRTACLEEVRLLKDSDSDEFINTDASNQPCKSSLALSDLKLPLHHDFVGALRAGRLDVGVFHFVVLAICGSKNVFSTKAVSTYDEMDGYSLLIKDNLYLTQVPHDFTLTLKVYGLHTKKSTDHTTRTKRAHSTGQQSPGNLKSLFAKRKDDDVFNCASPQTVFRTSRFKLVGETAVNLSILGNGDRYVLTKVPSNCPLEGFLQLRIGCRPEFTASSSGFLTIQEDIGGYTAWNRRWCNMKDNRIQYWRYPDDEDTKEPVGSIDLRSCTDKNVSILQRDICARPHTFELNLKRSAEAGDESNLVKAVEGNVVFIKVWICCDNKDDRITWMNALNKQLSDSRAWLLKKTVHKYSKKREERIVSEEDGVAVHV